MSKIPARFLRGGEAIISSLSNGGGSGFVITEEDISVVNSNTADASLTKSTNILDLDKVLVNNGGAVSAFNHAQGKIILSCASKNDTDSNTNTVPALDIYGNPQWNAGEQAKSFSTTFSFNTDAMTIQITHRQDAVFKLHIVVDGKFVSEDGHSVSNGIYTTITFSERKLRKIELVAYDGRLAIDSVQIAVDAQISKPSETGRVAVIGDSYSEGAEAGGAVNSWPAIIARKLGVGGYLHNGMGSTGVSATKGGDRYNYIERVRDVTKYNPELVIVGVSINDRYSVSTIAGDALALITELKKANQNVQIVFLGVAYAETGYFAGGDGSASEDACLSAIADIPGVSIFRAQTLPYFLVSGSGSVTNQTGDGNADYYFANSRAHYSKAGQEYWANFMLTQILNPVDATKKQKTVIALHAEEGTDLIAGNHQHSAGHSFTASVTKLGYQVTRDIELDTLAVNIRTSIATDVIVSIGYKRYPTVTVSTDGSVNYAGVLGGYVQLGTVTITAGTNAGTVVSLSGKAKIGDILMFRTEAGGATGASAVSAEFVADI